MEQMWLIVRVQISLTSFKGTRNLFWYTSCVGLCISYHCWADFWIVSSFLCSYLFKSFHKNRQQNNPKYNSFHSLCVFFLLYFLFLEKGIMLYCIFVLMTTVPTGNICCEWTHFHGSLKMKISMFPKKKIKKLLTSVRKII